MKQLFDGQSIDVVVEGKIILFNIEDVAYVVGYTRAASLEHHIRGTKYYIQASNGKAYTTKSGLMYAAKLATRTPILKRVADWSSKFKRDDLLTPVEKGLDSIMNVIKKPKVTPEPTTPLYGLSVVAKRLGMKTKELNDWLVDQGYAGRYSSNNSIYWKQWFRDQKYGTRPQTGGQSGKPRESNVPKFTQLGIDFVKNRIRSELQNRVLAFAQKQSHEAEKLEKEIDQLIVDTFKMEVGINSEMDLIYTVKQTDLLTKIKGIIAQVKLKEKK